MGRSAMPSDLSLKAVGPALGSSENPAQPKPETFNPPAQAPPASPAILTPNPTLRFDVATGLVVIEFHDESGNVTTSVPTLRQLEAYRQWGQTSPGQTSPGQTSPGRPPSGQAPPGQTSSGQTSSGQTTAGQRSTTTATVHTPATSEV